MQGLLRVSGFRVQGFGLKLIGLRFQGFFLKLG